MHQQFTGTVIEEVESSGGAKGGGLKKVNKMALLKEKKARAPKINALEAIQVAKLEVQLEHKAKLKRAVKKIRAITMFAGAEGLRAMSNREAPDEGANGAFSVDTASPSAPVHLAVHMCSLHGCCRVLTHDLLVVGLIGQASKSVATTSSSGKKLLGA